MSREFTATDTSHDATIRCSGGSLAAGFSWFRAVIVASVWSVRSIPVSGRFMATPHRCEVSSDFSLYQKTFHMEPQDAFHILPERGEHVFVQF